MKTLVGSLNPVKINSVKISFEKYFDNVEVIGMKAESKVRDQPIDDETYEGAKNRAYELYKNNKDIADYFVGIEGGIKKQYDTWFAFTGICIIDKNGKHGYGSTTAYQIPKIMVDDMLNGMEMGIVMDKHLVEKNSKQKNGAVYFFTKGHTTRTSACVDGVVSALVPFLHEELFNK